MSDVERELSIQATKLERAADRAIDLSYESALKNGRDIPVGALALRGDMIIGSGYAIDKQSGRGHLHAEVVAIEQAKENPRMMPDTIVTTMETCVQCQEALLRLPTLKMLAYIIPRTDLSQRGLVNTRPSIMERHAIGEFPFDVVRLDSQRLYDRAIAPINRTAVHRSEDGAVVVTVDKQGVARDKARFIARQVLDSQRIG